MRRLALVVVLLPLAGCAELTNALAPPYVPQPIHVYDAVQLARDMAECDQAGINWVPTFSLGSLATRTLDGATSNTSLIPLNPLVVPYGAAGGALGAASDGLDLYSGQHAAVYRNCLHDETLIDHSAVLANPHD